MPICILADGLYVSEKVINRCKEYNWSYIIRYKEGCASSIKEEYNAIKKLQKNISSDLLASFGWQLTTEDISVTDMHSISDK